MRANDDIETLRAEVSALREELADLRTRGETPARRADQPVSRRSLLGTLGAATAAGAGLAAGSALLSSKAASASTGAMQYGVTNNAGVDTTYLSGSGSYVFEVDATGSGGTALTVTSTESTGIYVQTTGTTNHYPAMDVRRYGLAMPAIMGSSVLGTGIVGNGVVGMSASGQEANLLIGPSGPPAPSRSTGATGQLVADQNGTLWYAIGTNQWRKLAGPAVTTNPATSGAFHLLAKPVRAYDSRPSGPGADGPLAGGGERTISLATVVPAGATGVLVNLTAVVPSGSGFLALYSAAVANPGTSNVNFAAGAAAVANTAVSALDPTGSLKAFCGPSGISSHLVIDVFGYYQ